MNKLRLVIPFLPPSINRSYSETIIYVRGRPRPKRQLSREAIKFISRFKEHVSQTYMAELSQFTPEKNAVFKLTIVTQFDNLMTKTKKAKHPYARKDVLWGAKLVQDILSEMLGQDDLYHFELRLIKQQGVPGLIIQLDELPPYVPGENDYT